MNKYLHYLPATLLPLLVAPGAARQRPNILYIMCDDLGYGDLSCYGQQHFSTPNIDRLAAQGMRMTSAYAGSPVSAPSRACFMTGQHSGHTHVRGNKEYWSGRVDYGQNVDYAVVGQEPYDPAVPILPELFKAAGYHTGMFGKWAGGYEGSISTPDRRGIDEFYGYICQFQAHLYFPNFLNRYSRSRGDTAVVREVLEQNIQHAMYGDDYDRRRQYSADLIHQRALEWLRQQKADEPFFGIFTYTLPHAELRQPDDSLLQAFRGRLLPERVYRGDNPSRYNPTPEAHAQFAAMITRLDAQVGEIMQLLEEQGLADNTVLIFTSDNGPHEEGGADPEFFNHDGKFRGLKRSTHEGGIRIPFIVRWPQHVRAGSESDLPFAFYDLMPTFCDIAKIRLSNHGRFKGLNVTTDGISILPTLTGKGRQRLHDHLYWEFHETDMLAVRRGDWKLVVKRGQPSLYNLADDPHEDHDLAAAHPDIVRLLVQKIYEDHTDSPLFPLTLPTLNNQPTPNPSPREGDSSPLVFNLFELPSLGEGMGVGLLILHS
jgi:arylsulfatase